MRNHPVRRLLAMALAIAMLACYLPAAGAAEYTDVHWEASDRQITVDRSHRLVEDSAEPAEADPLSMVRVSIVLEDKATLRSGYSTAGIAANAQAMAYNDRLKQKQEQLSATISAQVLGGTQLDVMWNLTLVSNIISANVPYGKIPAIEALPGVSQVVVEQCYQPEQTVSGTATPQMYGSSDMIGSQPVWLSGYTGAGSRIAIIDTGTDMDHQSFDAGGFLYSLQQNAAAEGTSYSSYLTSLDLLDMSDINAVLTQLNAYEYMACGAADLYFNEKVPFGFNYVDYNTTIIHDYDNQGSHGSHVASIAAANRYIPNGSGYADARETVFVSGVAPDAQILTMKVFGVNGGAYDSDYMAAIEDAILLGADSVNLSLGTSNAGNAHSGIFDEFLDFITTTDTVVVMSAGNNAYWSAASYYSYPYSDSVNFSTVGSPGSYTNSLAVASVDNIAIPGSAFLANGLSIAFMETFYNNRYFATLDLSDGGEGTEYDYVMITGLGAASDYDDIDLNGKIVLCSRGDLSFAEKANTAVSLGAAAVIVYNNEPGSFSMDLTDYYYSAPCVSITQEDAQRIMDTSEVRTTSGGLTYYTGKITAKSGYLGFSKLDYYTMSSFSSWGVPGDLSLKPEITAPGGSIYAVNGVDPSGKGYELMSGTSMAAPQVSGMAALVSQYLRESGKADRTSLSIRALTQSLLMSTAQPLFEEASGGNYYSILNQGAGLARVDLATTAESYILVNGSPDGKVKVELGDDPGRSGTYRFSFTINNLTDRKLQYALRADLFTQDVFDGGELSSDIFMDIWTRLLPASATFYVNGKPLQAGAGSYDCDLNDDGITNEQDADYLLEYLLGNVQILHADADLDGDGKLTSYDAHMLLAGPQGDPSATVPAGGSVTVDVTLALTADTKAYLDANYPAGTFIEAFVYAEPLTDREGNLGVTHSIPVLGFYGSWTESSMYDIGNVQEASLETLDRAPYLYHIHGGYTNSLAISYDGNEEYWFGGNPYVTESWYDPGRNAFNNESGYYLSTINYTLLRNAQDLMVEFVNADTGEVYHSGTYGEAYGAYYEPYLGAYDLPVQELGLWLDMAGIPENTRVEFRMAAAPEYYRKDAPDGSYTIRWEDLEDGAWLRQEFVIDNTAPEIFDVALNPDGSDSLVVSAQDNQHIAAILLLSPDGSQTLAAIPGDQTESNTAATFILELSDLYGAKFQVAVCDYAENYTVYDITLERESERPYFTMFHRGNQSYIGMNPDGSTMALAGGNRSTRVAEYVEGYIFEISDNKELWVASNDDLYSFTFLGYLDPEDSWQITNFCDLAYNRTDGKLYALFYSWLNSQAVPYLCTIDIHSGKMNVLGEMPVDVHSLAIDGEGNFYSVAYDYPSMYRYTSNVTESHAVTYVGDTGYYYTASLNSMAWDHNTDTLYWTVESFVLQVDCITAQPTAVGYLDNDASGLFIAYEPEYDPFAPVDRIDSISISGETSLITGNVSQLSAAVTPWHTSDNSIIWSSSNPNVATVDDTGLVYGVSDGTTTITAASAAYPSVKASCTVTVSTIDIQLQGLACDENGDFWWSSISISDSPDYTKLQQVDSNMPLCTTMVAGGTLYAATLDSYTGYLTSELYRVDPGTHALSYVGYSEYAHMDMAYSPSYGAFVSVYSNNILLNDLATGSYVGSIEFGYNDLVGITYYGSGTYNDYGTVYDVDYYLILDTLGDVYLLGFYRDFGIWYHLNGVSDGYVGNIGRPVDLWYYQDFYYDGTYAYWTRLGKNDSQVELILWDCDNSGHSYSLGYFPDSIWPISGLYSTDAIDYDMPLIKYSISAVQPSDAVKAAPAAPVPIPAAGDAALQPKEMPQHAHTKMNGGTMAVIPPVIMDSEEEEADQFRDLVMDIQIRIPMDAPSGMATMEFDPQFVEIVSVTGSTEAFAWTTENGYLEIAYASANTIAGSTEVAVVTVRSLPGGEHPVTITTTQLGSQTMALDDSFFIHGHVFDAVVTEPTCTQQGFTTYTCVGCGFNYTDDFTDVTAHDFGGWYVAEEAGCTEEGVEQRDCRNCEHSETRSIEAAGHDYQAVVTEPTCKEGGYTTYTCHCGDSYVDDYTDPADHTYENGVCTGCGQKEPGYLLGDVNEDGSVDTTDAYFIILYYNERLELTESQLKAADTNGDGSVDTTDAYYIVLYYNERIPAFPAEEL